MVTTYPFPRVAPQQVWLRDEANAFAAWLRADLHRRFDEAAELPPEMLQLIENACTPRRGG